MIIIMYKDKFSIYEVFSWIIVFILFQDHLLWEKAMSVMSWLILMIKVPL